MKRSEFLNSMKRHLEGLSCNIETDPYTYGSHHYLEIDNNDVGDVMDMFEDLFELPWEDE